MQTFRSGADPRSRSLDQRQVRAQLRGRCAARCPPSIEHLLGSFGKQQVSRRQHHRDALARQESLRRVGETERQAERQYRATAGLGQLSRR